MVDETYRKVPENSYPIDDEVRTTLACLIENIDKMLFDSNKADGSSQKKNVANDEIHAMEQLEGEEEQANLETDTLLWCDAQVNSTEDNRETQIELRQSINFLKTFESVDLCKLYIERKPNEEITLIVSGSAGKTLVPNIHHLSQVVAIYVFCLDLREHEV